MLDSRRLLETDLRIIIVVQGGVDKTGWDRCDQGRNCRHFNAKNNLYSVLYLSPRKLHPVLRAERAEKDRFATGHKNDFFGCLMNVILGVVK